MPIQFIFISITTLLLLLSATASAHQPMVDLIHKIKPSIVGIGLYDPLAAPKAQLLATGFAIGDGSLIATNAHAIPELKPLTQQKVAVFLTGSKVKAITAELIKKDKHHDLAILRIKGQKLPPLSFTKSPAQEGQEIAFTGFPIGSILGLYPTTHRGMLSAIAPVIIPVPKAASLTPAQLKMLRNPYDVFQLDATAYPGNSGSPVYDVHSAEVVAVINKVLLTGNKESALTHPSAITYAIPVKHLKKMLRGISE